MGSFETNFLKRMTALFGGSSSDAVGVAHAIEHSVNLLSTIYAQVYFPTFSNGLKEIANADYCVRSTVPKNRLVAF